MTSIQRRLTLALALLCCTLWTAGGIALYVLLRAGLVGEFDHTSRVTAQRLAALTEHTESMGAFEVDRERYLELLKRAVAKRGVRFD